MAAGCRADRARGRRTGGGERRLRQLPFSTSIAHDWSVDNIDSFLLHELRAGPRSQHELAAALGDWGREASSVEMMEALERLRQQGSIDGPGVSLLHHLRVWLTPSGEVRARKAADNLPGWRPVRVTSRRSPMHG